MKGTMDGSFIPKTYEELYTHYIAGSGHASFCKKLVRNFLPYVEVEEVDNFAHDVFLRCVQHKVIEKYDSTKANFGGVLFFVTKTICCTYLSKKTRDPIGGLRVGSLVEASVEGSKEITLESLVVDEHEDLKHEAKDLVEKLTMKVDSIADLGRSTRDKKLKELLGLLFEGYTVEECAAELRVTKSTVYNWLGYLKRLLEEIEVL